MLLLLLSMPRPIHILSSPYYSLFFAVDLCPLFLEMIRLVLKPAETSRICINAEMNQAFRTYHHEDLELTILL